MNATVTIERSGNTVYYSIHGTYDEVTKAVDDTLQSWPTPGYGTWFNWPPNSKTGYDGKLVTYLAATQKDDGTWIGRGHRSTSCD